MGVVGGVSAPEQVDALSPLWAGLPAERIVELGFKWVNLSIRTILPVAFERCGHSGIGAILRTFPPIIGFGSLHFAYEQLTLMKIDDAPIDALAAFLSAAAFLKSLNEEFSIAECCFLTVMASRHAFGDDRAIDTIRADLIRARPPEEGP